MITQIACAIPVGPTVMAQDIASGSVGMLSVSSGTVIGFTAQRATNVVSYAASPNWYNLFNVNITTSGGSVMATAYTYVREWDGVSNGFQLRIVVNGAVLSESSMFVGNIAGEISHLSRTTSVGAGVQSFAYQLRTVTGTNVEAREFTLVEFRK